MGASPDTHLFYGYVWDAETSLHSLLHPDEDDEDTSDDWKEVLLKRRGVTSPWDVYPGRDALIKMGAGATAEQYEMAIANGNIFIGTRGRDDYVNERVGSYVYQQTPEFKGIYATWREANSALDDEFACELSAYGGEGFRTAYLYVANRRGTKHSLRSSWDGPTEVDPSLFGETADPWWRDDQLSHFIKALNLPMEGDGYSDPPRGPGWFMVTSYG